MFFSAVLSTCHLLALCLGLPGIFLRARALRAVTHDASALATVLQADAAWGIAALLWLTTGLTRAFGPFEKGSGYYLHSGPFFIKMGLFVAVLLLELWPMISLIRWRIAQAKHQPLDLSAAPRLARVSEVEFALTLAMPFFASAMARGLGFGWFN